MKNELNAHLFWQIIENISLVDIRPGPRAIKSLIHRKLDDKTDKTTPEAPIVTFNHKFSESGGTTSMCINTGLMFWVCKNIEDWSITSFETHSFLGFVVELETTSLTLVLALDYLMQILAFFQTTGPYPDVPKQDVSLRLEPTSVLPTGTIHCS